MHDLIKCIIVDDEPVAREILENHLSHINYVKVEASCRDAVDAFRIINSHDIDLVFLDINMPGISGLSFARSVTKDIKIIFTTAYREYAVDGFDLMAVDYLLKPISLERLMQALNKFSLERGSKSSTPGMNTTGKEDAAFFVRADRKMTRIPVDEIRYLESLGDYVKIHISDRIVVTRETLVNLEEKLPAERFLKIHRSFIVSIQHIESYTGEYVEIGKNQLPISRGYREEVRLKLRDASR